MDEVTSYSFTLLHSTYLNVTGRKIKMPILALLDARAGETLLTGKFWSFPSQQLPFPSWNVQEKQRWQPLRCKKIGGKKQVPNQAIAGITMLRGVWIITNVWPCNPLSEVPELLKFFYLKWGLFGPRKATLGEDLDHRFCRWNYTDVGESLQWKAA